MLTSRIFFFLVPLLLFVGCGEDEARPEETTSSPLENVTRTAFSDAFQRLDDQGYVAELTYREGPPGSLSPENRYLVRVEDEVIHVLETTEERSDDPAFRLRDPLPHVLPEDPPYLDPRTRDYYALSTQERGNGTLVVGALDAESDQNLPIHRVEALTTRGQLTHLQLDRHSESLLLDESERVEIQLTHAAGSWVPSRVVLETTVDLPGDESVSRRQSWNVLEVGGLTLEQ